MILIISNFPLSWQSMLSPRKGQTVLYTPAMKLIKKKRFFMVQEACPSPSTRVFPAWFARRFVASSLQNKLFPQTFNIILKYLMSCGKYEEKHPFFPHSTWGSTLVIYHRTTLTYLRHSTVGRRYALGWFSLDLKHYSSFAGKKIYGGFLR